jgi:lipopolysaccharide/colanic/teichoic acid biosynthesis glycosyltransferase
MIRIDSQGHIFSSKKGYDFWGKEVSVLRFRTTRSLSGDAGAARHQVTPIGRFLRRTRLDELPVLLNVLRGDLSIVGPPTISSEDVRAITRSESLQNMPKVKCGVTGVNQLAAFRTKGMSPTEIVGNEAAYAASWSIWRDIEVLARTVTVVLVGASAY